MKILKDLVLKHELEKILKEKIANEKISPMLINLFSESTENMDKIFNSDNIPFINYRSNTSASSHNKTFEELKGWINLVSSSLNSLVIDYSKFSKSYTSLCSRIYNETNVLRQDISNMVNYVCFYISPLFIDQDKSSSVNRIGKYITLPYYISSVKMYNDSVILSALSDNDIVFSNIKSITSLPLNEWPCLKINAKLGENTFSLNAKTSTTTANMFYIKFLNEVISVTISLQENSETRLVKEFKDKEILWNFLPTDFNSIDIKVRFNNLNTDKPFAVQIVEFKIFESIKFSKNSSFVSNSFLLKNSTGVEEVNLSYSSTGDPSSTTTKKMISVSQLENEKNYMIVEDNALSLTPYKFRNSRLFNGVTSVKPIGMTEEDYKITINNKEYFQIPINKETEGDLWNLNFKGAIVLHGLNADFASNGNQYWNNYKLPFENWTKTGNYWKTMVLVLDDIIHLDIGHTTCKINGGDYTGRFSLESGIYIIEVHEQYIDFKFGNQAVSDYSSLINDKINILKDPLYPYNFAYLFSGLPEYDDTTNKISSKVRKRWEISGTTTLSLNETFIPLSITVKDGTGRLLTPQLTKGVSKPGTFFIEPFLGKVTVYPYLDNNKFIIVEYIKASSWKRPSGVLFNRLLTYIPVKVLLSLRNIEKEDINYRYLLQNELFFSLDGDLNSKTILLEDLPEDQSLPSNRIEHSQILYNSEGEHLFLSTKIDLQTNNRYLSPIISDIYLAAK